MYKHHNINVISIHVVVYLCLQWSLATSSDFVCRLLHSITFWIRTLTIKHACYWFISVNTHVLWNTSVPSPIWYLPYVLSNLKNFVNLCITLKSFQMWWISLHLFSESAMVHVFHGAFPNGNGCQSKSRVSCHAYV